MPEKHEPCDNPTCQEAADRAVKKVFAILGVDIDKPDHESSAGSLRHACA